MCLEKQNCSVIPRKLLTEAGTGLQPTIGRQKKNKMMMMMMMMMIRKFTNDA
jgi:hypothetical protein